MAYYKPEEDLENRIIIRNPLSSEEIGILMTGEEAENRLSDNENPAALSIEKWKRMQKLISILSKKTDPEFFYPDLIYFIGYKTCALCLNSIEQYELKYGIQKYKENRCLMCPLRKIDCCLDTSSAFNKIVYLLEGKVSSKIKPGIDFSSISSAERLKMIDDAILKMIENLKMIKGSKF